MTPMPTQLTGAQFLASRRTALLADEPRVGKTGAALLAAEILQINTMLIVTTSSGRAVWRRAVKDWLGRDAFVLGVDRSARDTITIVSWDALRSPAAYAALTRVESDLLVCDEDHRAKNPETKTAQAIYGNDPPAPALAGRADRHSESGISAARRCRTIRETHGAVCARARRSFFRPTANFRT